MGVLFAVSPAAAAILIFESRTFRESCTCFRNIEIVSIAEDTQSVMPPVQAPAEEFQDLLAYLCGLTGVKPGALVTKPTSQASDIEFNRILHPRPGDWLSYDGKLNANRYSDLTQINTSNVNQLRVQWIFTVPLWRNLVPDTSYFVQNFAYFGLEVTPLVADGVMYITGPGSVYAMTLSPGVRFGHTRASVRQPWLVMRPWGRIAAWPSLATRRL